MSFLRKFVSKLQVRKRSSDSVDAVDSLTVRPDEERLLNESTSSFRAASSQTTSDAWQETSVDKSVEDNASFISVRETTSDDDKASNVTRSASLTSIDRKLRKDRRRLNKKLDKYRRERWRVERRAAEVQHLQNEISAVMKMLVKLDKQKHLLDEEKNNKLRELFLTCKLVPEDVSPELRKKEPLQFKKYHSAKSVTDTQNLLHNIHLKQKALRYLEVMSFKKMLNFEHNGFIGKMKNNNNMLEESAIAVFMQDAMANFENLERERDEQTPSTSTPNFCLTPFLNARSSPASDQLSMGFDNPLFASI